MHKLLANDLLLFMTSLAGKTEYVYVRVKESARLALEVLHLIISSYIWILGWSLLESHIWNLEYIILTFKDELILI